MSGISHPDRQVECSGCRRILTLQTPVRTADQTAIACPGCGVTTPLKEIA